MDAGSTLAGGTGRPPGSNPERGARCLARGPARLFEPGGPPGRKGRSPRADKPIWELADRGGDGVDFPAPARKLLDVYGIQRFSLAVFISAVVLGMSSLAEAQIYSWRDANGSLVLSDRVPASAPDTYLVAHATSVRATRPASSGYAGDYEPLIVHHAAANNLRPDLVRAVIQVESGFNPRAVSPKGAVGLMQLMPGTAAELGVGNPFNPAENIKAGSAYLRQLLDKFDNNEELALAAYNAGPEAVDRYGQRVPPYRETLDYVRQVKKRTEVSSSSVRRVIYKTVQIVDGRRITTYTDTKPSSGLYEVVDTRR